MADEGERARERKREVSLLRDSTAKIQGGGVPDMLVVDGSGKVLKERKGEVRGCKEWMDGQRRCASVSHPSATSICNQTLRRAGGCEQRLMKSMGRCIFVSIECGFEDIRIVD